MTRRIRTDLERAEAELVTYELRLRAARKASDEATLAAVGAQLHFSQTAAIHDHLASHPAFGPEGRPTSAELFTPKENPDDET